MAEVSAVFPLCGGSVTPAAAPSVTQSVASLPPDAAQGIAPSKRKRRGPKRGSIDRYGTSDEALFPIMEELKHKEKLSNRQAALRLAHGDVEGLKVEGNGTPESRAARLVNRKRRYEHRQQSRRPAKR